MPARLDDAQLAVIHPPRTRSARGWRRRLLRGGRRRRAGRPGRRALPGDRDQRPQQHVHLPGAAAGDGPGRRPRLPWPGITQLRLAEPLPFAGCARPRRPAARRAGRSGLLVNNFATVNAGPHSPARRRSAGRLYGLLTGATPRSMDTTGRRDRRQAGGRHLAAERISAGTGHEERAVTTGQLPGHLDLDTRRGLRHPAVRLRRAICCAASTSGCASNPSSRGRDLLLAESQPQRWPVRRAAPLGAGAEVSSLVGAGHRRPGRGCRPRRPFSSDRARARGARRLP